MRDKKNKNLLDNDIVNSSVFGVGLVLCLSLVFNIKVTILSLLLGILLGGLVNAYINILIISHFQEHLKFRYEVDELIRIALSDHLARIEQLENKINELEEGRH